MAFTLSQPSYGQAGSYSAQQDRLLINGDSRSAGVRTITAPSGGALTGDLAVTVSATASCVNVAAGDVWIDGGSGQGLYYAYNDASLTSAAFASCPTNTRIDLVVVQVTDTGLAAPSVSLLIVQGTAAASPTVPAVPAKATPLAQVLIQNGFVSGTTAVLAANITDRRLKAHIPNLMVTSNTQVASPVAGQLISESSTGRILEYNGSAWQRVGNFSSAGRTGISLARNAGQTITSGAGTAVAWDTQPFASDASYTVSGGSVTLGAGLGGLYVISVSVVWGANPTTTGTSAAIQISASISGATRVHENVVPTGGYFWTAGGYYYQATTVMYNLSAGDGFTTYVLQTSGVNVTISATLDAYRVAI